MYWNRLYAARSYIASALWLVPLIALILDQAAVYAVSTLSPLPGLDTAIFNIIEQCFASTRAKTQLGYCQINRLLIPCGRSLHQFGAAWSQGISG